MQGPALSTCDRCSCIVLQTRLISHYGRRPGHLSCFALRFVQGHEEETEPTTALFPGSKTPERCDAVAFRFEHICCRPLSFGGALLVRPWPRFHTPLIEPDRQICRVARPLLAFAPTEPTVRRYGSGLFRKDLRRVDHCHHAWWITGSGREKAIRSWR